MPPCGFVKHGDRPPCGGDDKSPCGFVKLDDKLPCSVVKLELVGPLDKGAEKAVVKLPCSLAKFVAKLSWVTLKLEGVVVLDGTDVPFVKFSRELLQFKIGLFSPPKSAGMREVRSCCI